MIIRLTSICGAALLAAALGAPAWAQGSLSTWRHGVIVPTGDAGFSMMVSRHGFAEKQGLKIEILKFKNGPIAHKALLAGEIDSIEASPGATILAGAQGADIKILGCNLPGVPHGLMVRSTIAKVEDLKGKMVAVSAPGSLSNILINALLEKYKIAESDVHFASLGDDLDRYKAVVAGVADAGVVAAEFMSIAPKNVTMLVAVRDILPNYLRECLTTTGKTLANRRAEAIGFIAAEMDALRFAVTHRDETINLTHEVINAKPDDPRPAYAYDDAIKHGAVDPAVSMPLDKLNWMQNELVRAGILKAAIKLTKITDADIRAEAAKRLHERGKI
jgi:NitT/TauT family transport system substrate-binding protein